MSIPAPKPGLVIRYSFLWSRERDAGAEEATKERPCAIIVATARSPDGDIRTIVAPITHSPPDDPLNSIEIPTRVSRALGLDAGRNWLRIDELNRFSWPGYDLRPIPGRPGQYAYGMLPEDLFETLRKSILARHAARRGRTQVRG